MKHGVLFSCQDPPGSPIGHPAVYEAALEQTVQAEQQGYDWVNITEHHVAADGYLPALIPLLTGMATLTKRIRLSTGMLILTLHHPIRIAEEAAVLDLISGGRLTLGVGVGYPEVEVGALGIDFPPRGRRFKEAPQIKALAVAGEAVLFGGENLQ